MQLPNFFIFDFDFPFALVDGNILSISSKQSNNFLEVFGKKYPLSKYTSLEKLTEIYYDIHSSELQEFKSQFVQSVLRAEFARNDQVNQSLRENKILEMIIQDILPALKEDPDFGGQSQSRIEDINPRTSISRAVVQRLATQVQNQYRNNTQEIDSLNNLVFLGPRYAQLGIDNSSLCHVKLNDQHFFGAEPQLVSRLRERCMNDLERRLKIQALQEDVSNVRVISRAHQEREQLRDLLRQNNYSSHGIGFKKEGNGYHVFATLKPYALISPFDAGLYYHGKAAKIGVLISRRGGGFSVGHPKVLNRCKHPYLSDSGGDICMGSYDYALRHLRNPADKAIQLISDAKRKLRELYYGRGTPYHHIVRNNHEVRYDRHLDELYIDLRTVRRLSLPITNLALVKRERGENYGPSR